MNMIKNSLSASSRQLGFLLVEPHKVQEEEYQEQRDPNVPEPVYSVSQQYRHLLNTFLRFSRDIIVNLKGEENSRCFKEEDNHEYKQKQQIMGYQLQISDLKDKVKKAEKELKLLQDIYQNHLDSRLQIIDLKDYDANKMNESAKECVERIKQSHKILMELQTIFLTNGNDMKEINKD